LKGKLFVIIRLYGLIFYIYIKAGTDNDDDDDDDIFMLIV